MDKKEKFTSVSSKIIKKFATGLGVCIYKRRTDGTFYDPITGQYQVEFADTSLLMAFEDAVLNADGSTTTTGYISGDELAFSPKESDIIQSYTGEFWMVTGSSNDMYNAHYEVALKLINEVS